MAENSPVSMKALTFSGVSCELKPRWAIIPRFIAQSVNRKNALCRFLNI